jgi:DeoR/GlpR family transcriptional regulator of sugar metabolism
MADARGAMIPDQRRDAIMERLRRERVLALRPLSQHLGVSEMTVRRDIAQLERDGRAVATAGGVRLPDRLLSEPTRREKDDARRPQKDAIARVAAELVRDAMTVYLDAGTTIQAIRPHLERVRELTVVTNDLAIVQAFLDHPSVDLIAVGGRVDASNLSTTGRLTRLALLELSIDLALISSSSWDLRHGVTTPVEAKVDAKRAAVEVAERSVLMADSAKHGRFAKYRALRLDQLDAVITDDAMPADAAAELRSAGIELRLAGL